MNKRTIGTCGDCGGAVTEPTVYMSVVPPVPSCEDCGARVKPNYGPTLPMQP